MLNIKVDWDLRFLSVEEKVNGNPLLPFITYSCNGITSRGINMAATLPDNLTGTLTFIPKDSFGLPAKIDGLPTYTSSDETILTVTAHTDGTAVVAPANPPKLGTAQVTVSADADLGSGVKTITGLIEIEVVAGEAVSLDVGFQLNTPPAPAP